MTYREAATMEQQETWGAKARAVARIVAPSTAGIGLLLLGISLMPRACDRMNPCADGVALLNAAGQSVAICDHRATPTVTQVATGQLVRCTCGRAR